MRFFADENIPTSVVYMLRSLGHDVSYVIERNLCGQKDIYLYKLSIEEKRHFMTRDLDFANILIYPPTDEIGIIVLRVKNDKPSKISLIISHFFQQYKGELKGKLIILDENKFRVRRKS